MTNLKYVTFEKIALKNSPEFNERWVHERLVESVSILGLGDLVVKDRERVQ